MCAAALISRIDAAVSFMLSTSDEMRKIRGYLHETRDIRFDMLALGDFSSSFFSEDKMED